MLRDFTVGQVRHSVGSCPIAAALPGGGQQQLVLWGSSGDCERHSGE
jgi:hypothetical protein